MAQRALFLVSCIVPLLPLSAQNAGRVVDPSGMGLGGVSVELWSNRARIANTLTSSDGSFRLPETDSVAVRVSFRLVGFRPFYVTYGRELLRVPVILEPIPRSLPAIAVATSQQHCPLEPDSAASELVGWAQARYSPQTGTKGFAAQTLRIAETITEDRVGFPDWERADPGSLRYVGATWPPSGGRFDLIDSMIAHSGYAWPNRTRGGVWRAGPRWAYPALESIHAFHFATSTFRHRHNFRLVERTMSWVLVAFCPVDRGGSTISGTLAIAPDTAFLAATWRFATSKPSEYAGGEVLFAPPAPGVTEQHLTPARGIFWRRAGSGGLFYQRAAAFLSWTFSASDTMPELPPRPASRVPSW